MVDASEEIPPPSPTIAGWLSLTLGLLAAVLTVIGFVRASGDGLTAKEAAKLVRLEVVIGLLAVFLGVVGRSSAVGKAGLVLSILLLIAASILFAAAAVA